MSKASGKFLTFMKKNGVYMILALCILAIGASVALAEVNKRNKAKSQAQTDPGSSQVEPIVEPSIDEDPIPKTVTFIVPVSNATSISDYSDTMVFNSTLRRYSAHKAIDFYAEEGSNVYAVYDGVVESVDSTLLEGITVVIDHGDGLKTVYNSLMESDSVTVGQTVKQGDVIGSVSTSNRTEYSAGAHLHFSVEENGKAIDPVKYLTIDEK